MMSYKVISRPNPNNRSLAPKYYPLPVYSGIVTLDELSKLMSDGSTVREGDVYAVLIEMVNAVSQQLAEGKIVRLGKLGNFRIVWNSEGALQEKEASSHLIKRNKIRYYPAKELQNMLTTLDYKKLSP